MAEGVDSIRKELEDTYDIPFDVKESYVNGEPHFYMGPTSDSKDFFYIHVWFSNRIRISAEFMPETYGADFVRSMARRPKNDREIFWQFVTLMEKRGAKVTVAINNETLTHDGFIEYNRAWGSLKISMTRIPVSEEKRFSYTDKALEWGSLMMGMVLSMADIVPLDDMDSAQPVGHKEGKQIKSMVKRYERNPINRKLCLEAHGYACSICGMNFEDTYGEIGHAFIHVHHIMPVSQLGEDYVIDPINDLIPVCPNCHAMLHKKDPPYQPEELKKIMEEKNRTSI